MEPGTEGKKRDWVDYLDIMLKLLGGGILAAVTIFINTNNELQKTNNDLKQQEINNTLKYGEFTKSLLQELLTQDSSHLKRDMALIVLNRTIGDSNKKLIADIGYCLVADYYGTNQKNADFSTMKRIVEIVYERDTADSIRVSHIIEKYVAGENTRGNLQESEIKNNDTTVSTNISSEKLDKLTLLPSKATVFAQVNNNNPQTMSAANNLLDVLKSKGFNTPGIEVIDRFKFRNAIKYFYTNDEAAAKQIKESLHKIQPAEDVPIQKVNNPKARQGIIEVWWNFP